MLPLLSPQPLANLRTTRAATSVLNLTWDRACQVLYDLAAAEDASVALALLHCSLGDVVIALVTFALAGIVLRRADWPASRPWTGGAIVVIQRSVRLRRDEDKDCRATSRARCA